MKNCETAGKCRLTEKQSERLYRTLIELWCDQYGVDLRLVSIRPTDGPEKITMIGSEDNV